MKNKHFIERSHIQLMYSKCYGWTGHLHMREKMESLCKNFRHKLISCSVCSVYYTRLDIQILIFLLKVNIDMEDCSNGTKMFSVFSHIHNYLIATTQKHANLYNLVSDQV